LSGIFPRFLSAYASIQKDSRRTSLAGMTFEVGVEGAAFAENLLSTFLRKMENLYMSVFMQDKPTIVT